MAPDSATAWVARGRIRRCTAVRGGNPDTPAIAGSSGMGGEFRGVVLDVQGHLLQLVLVSPGMVGTEEELPTIAQCDAHVGLCAATITTVRSGEGVVLDHRGAHDNLLRFMRSVTVLNNVRHRANVPRNIAE